VLVEEGLRFQGQGDLFVGELLGAHIIVPYYLTQLRLTGVVLMASIRTDPALYLIVRLFYRLDAFMVRAIFIGDLVLDETDLLGQVGSAVDEFFEYDGGILGLDRGRHLLYEVY
jgi:hypothetical protein